MLVRRLDPEFRITLGESPNLSVELEKSVNDIWNSNLRLGARFFDGPIYSVVEFSERNIEVIKLSYRYLFARRRDGTLSEKLSVRPLAVTGMLCCADGFVVGLRGDRVAVDMGKWELLPSGGLEQLNPRMQVLHELEEELGISPNHISEVTPLGMAYDSGDDVFDIVFKLVTGLSGAEIFKLFETMPAPEHAKIAVESDLKTLTQSTYQGAPCHPIIGAALSLI